MAKSKQTDGLRKWIIATWVIGMLPLVFVIGVLTTAFLDDLPAVETLANPHVNLATKVISIDGKTLGTYYKENREDIKFSEIPPHLVDALLSTEDVRFREHSGVDFVGLFRAFFSAGQEGGGSTITQQLAKMQFTKQFENVSFSTRVFQKIKEWIIACRLESLYTKDELIALYLNQYDFLNQAVGIKSAAHIYFNTTPQELNIEQSAMLVGMLKNSSLYNPMKRDSLVTKRREVVMDQMVKYGYLSEAAYDSLRVKPLGINFQRMTHTEGVAPYFREVLRGVVEGMLQEKDENGNFKYAKADGQPYDIYRDGLKIYTTIDTKLQAHAEWAVREHLKKELQPAFTRDVGRRNPEKYPFYNKITDNDKQAIMNRAVHESERYKLRMGKTCPDCRRPEFYITEEDVQGKHQYRCDESKSGCGHVWDAVSEEEVLAEFNQPIPMEVFSIWGPVDTILSPLDSIKYIKTILHASLMSLEPQSGYVKAWVGGIDFKNFQFDNVYQSARQVGSTFKPLVYATALRMGKSPKDPVDGSRFCWGNWCPRGGGGSHSMKCALANSINTVAARLAYTYGIDNVIKLARRVGIKEHLEPSGPLALGAANIPLYQMVGAIATFANQGVHVSPSFIIRIEDKNGTAIYEPEPTIEQALGPCESYHLIDMMKAVVDGSCGSGTGVRLKYSGKPYGGIKYPTAGKTGTTQNNTDGWFIGVTPELVTGVWVGAQDPTVRFSSTGVGQGANTGLPIYGYYMNRVYKDNTIQISTDDFKPPVDCDLTPEKMTATFIEGATGTGGEDNLNDMFTEDDEEENVETQEDMTPEPSNGPKETKELSPDE